MLNFVLLSSSFLQLSENARKWAHEKADLQLRLQEAEYGLKHFAGGMGSNGAGPADVSSPLDRYAPYSSGYGGIGDPYYNSPRDYMTSSRRDANENRRAQGGFNGGRNQRLPNINSISY